MPRRRRRANARLDEGSQEESGVRDQQAAPHHDRPPGGRRRQIRPLATVGYWLATLLVAAELGLGGIWDIERLPMVHDLVTHLGSPSYFLVLLGIWKVLGAVALLVPRRGLLKEWAYAGAFFTYTGAIASHLTTGYDLGELWLLAVLTALTVVFLGTATSQPPHPRLPWVSARTQGGWCRCRAAR
jgi:hypothetical protein